MNYITVFVTVAATLTLAGTASGREEKAVSGKELTLLYSRNCADLTTSLQDKVTRLREEITNGRRIYTPEEIRKLEGKLKEMDEMVDSLMYRPGD